jgi:hypothetical protein
MPQKILNILRRIVLIQFDVVIRMVSTVADEITALIQDEKK